MKVWCHDDVHVWGEDLFRVLNTPQFQRAGAEPHMFDDPRQPDEGFVLWHMHHHPSVRHKHKQAMALMAMNPKLTLWPSYQTSIMFDDKMEQARQLSKFMPPTRAFFTPRQARVYLETATFPFYSKAIDGVNSGNVRKVESYKQGAEEIKYVFSDKGLKLKNSQAQRGYLLYQEAVPDCDHDIRILVAGSKRLILRRLNKAADRASRIEPCAPEHSRILDPVLTEALKAAEPIIKAANMNLGMVDLLHDKRTDDFKLLEITASWSMHDFDDCYFVNVAGEVIEHEGHPIKGARLWYVVASEMLQEHKNR